MNVEKGYEELANVLLQALDQAQWGKGRERHNPDRKIPFTEQVICRAARLKGRGFLEGQIIKKIEEVNALTEPDAKINELLGLIVYAAADIIILREEMEQEYPYSVENYIIPKGRKQREVHDGQ